MLAVRTGRVDVVTGATDKNHDSAADIFALATDPRERVVRRFPRVHTIEAARINEPQWVFGNICVAIQARDYGGYWVRLREPSLCGHVPPCPVVHQSHRRQGPLP